MYKMSMPGLVFISLLFSFICFFVNVCFLCWCIQMNIGPYRVWPLSFGTLLSQITFWHSSLFSEMLRSFGSTADGGPNDKASLTISRQQQGGERGNWTVTERREERRKGGGRGDPIQQNGSRHNLFIWCPSASTFFFNSARLTSPLFLHCFISPYCSIPSIFYTFWLKLALHVMPVLF